MDHHVSTLTIDDIAIKLGLAPQFLYEAAELASFQYALFDLPKRAGGVRTICSPKNELKRLQRTILEEILWDFKMPAHVHGSVKGRSIATNAKPHINKQLVLAIDLKDFFGTVKVDVVERIYVQQFKCDPKTAEVLTRLTTYGTFLPQGAPTSPTLANIAALSLDEALMAICRDSGLSFDYTRYVDDITISGDSKLAFLLGPFYRTIREHGFKANPEKFKAGRPSERQKVTGVIVNKKLSPPKKLLRKIRQQLYYCQKFGIGNHCEREDISTDQFLSELNGLLGYVRVTQPDVADELKVRLTNLQILQSASALDEEAGKLLLLRYAVQEEKTVTFSYNGTHRRVAPSEIGIGDSGVKFLRAYQIYPDMKWERFDILAIRDVAIEGFRT